MPGKWAGGRNQTRRHAELEKTLAKVRQGGKWDNKGTHQKWTTKGGGKQVAQDGGRLQTVELKDIAIGQYKKKKVADVANQKDQTKSWEVIGSAQWIERIREKRRK